MALLDDKTLLKLPVVTKSGTALGKVAGFEFDVDAQAIVRYLVRPKGLAARMLKHPLRVSRDQVVSIDDEKMVVEDALAKEMELARAKAIGLVSSEVKA